MCHIKLSVKFPHFIFSLIRVKVVPMGACMTIAELEDFEPQNFHIEAYH